jgi:hypothetical protein
MSNLLTDIYNMLYYTTNLYLQLVLEKMSIYFNALIDTFHRVPPDFFLAFFYFLIIFAITLFYWRLPSIFTGNLV